MWLLIKEAFTALWLYSSQNSRIAAICIAGLFDPLQIENEYGDSESAYGSGGQPYAMWAASMALSQNTGVPWIMCQQYDAPDPVVSFLISFLSSWWCEEKCWSCNFSTKTDETLIDFDKLHNQIKLHYQEVLFCFCWRVPIYLKFMIQ